MYSIANKYDIQNKASLKKYDLDIKFFENIKIKKIKPKTVLDLGCGTGNLNSIAITTFPSINKIIGIDNSKEEIKIAKKNNLSEKINFFVRDMNKTQLPKNYFDLIYSRLAIHYSKNLNETFKELNRITKSKGWIYFQDAHPIYSLFLKKSKDYEKKENVEFLIQGGDLKVVHPTFTLEEYINAIINNGWKIELFREIYGPRSNSIKNYRLPATFIMLLRKTN